MRATRSYQRRRTAARGLGGPHQADRQAALAGLRDGDPCFRCELRGVYHPMFRRLVTVNAAGRYVSRWLDLDHYPGRAFGGPQTSRLSWRRCNRSSGARIGNRIRKVSRQAGYGRW